MIPTIAEVFGLVTIWAGSSIRVEWNPLNQPDPRFSMVRWLYRGTMSIVCTRWVVCPQPGKLWPYPPSSAHVSPEVSQLKAAEGDTISNIPQHKLSALSKKKRRRIAEKIVVLSRSITLSIFPLVAGGTLNC